MNIRCAVGSVCVLTLAASGGVAAQAPLTRLSLDDAGRARLHQVYERALAALRESLSEELQKELATLTLPLGGTPSQSEIRIAQAQLVGWLEGLFHGIQAALWSQQMAARAQLEQMGRRGLPPGPEEARGHGQYL